MLHIICHTCWRLYWPKESTSESESEMCHFLPENRITVAISSLALLFLLLKMTQGLIVDRAL